MTYLLAHASAHRIPLRDESVQTCVTSPPYWGLRAYAGEQSFVWGGDSGHVHEWETRTREPKHSDDGVTGSTLQGGKATQAQAQRAPVVDGSCTCGAWYGALGLEPTPDLFVAHMVEVFREVRRVLRKDGTLWLNLGDSYAGGMFTGRNDTERETPGGRGGSFRGGERSPLVKEHGLKPKDLVGIPWRVAFALQADGWYLRSDIVWAKPNPMPESVTDRPTKSHEYVFLLTKSERYYYDAEAIREAAMFGPSRPRDGVAPQDHKLEGNGTFRGGSRANDGDPSAGRNARSVWNIATQPYPGAHFATFPEEIPERCIKAGSAAQACSVCGAPWERVTERGYIDGGAKWAPNAGNRAALGDVSPSSVFRTGQRAISTTLGFEPTCAHDAPTVGSVVLDPFNGSGTTGRVAMRLGRRYVGLDLSREYLIEQAIARIDPIAAAARDFRNGVDQSQGVLL